MIEKEKQQNTNRLLSKRTVVHPSCGLNRLVKQRGDVFLLVSVSRTQHHHSILHGEENDNRQAAISGKNTKKIDGE